MQVGDVVGGRYRLVRLLGRGGMGVVYEAHDDGLDRSVALKVLNPPVDDEDFRIRFSREATVLARLRSPHILTIFDHGTHGEHMYLVTELVPDGDLQTWVRTRGPFSPLIAVELCGQLCDALSDAHHLGVIHRDVKPANVLLWNRRDGLWAYLADFGIAREGSESLTRSGAVVGSVSYMAPERHLGHDADERSDIYSVGCVLWSLLEGRAPYSGTDFQVMNAHLHEPIPGLAETLVGRHLIEPVLDRLLAKQPDERIATADQARSELAALAEQLREVVGADDVPQVAAPVAVDDSDVTMMRADSGELVPASRTPTGGTGPLDSPTTLTPHDALAETQRQPEEKGRRGLFVGAAAALLVAVIGVGGALVAQGDDPADDTTGPTRVTSTSPDPTPSAPPPPPDVEHRPAYRGVAYDVVPVEGATLQVRRDGEWADLAMASFTEPTKQGGEKVCLAFRAVSTSSGRSSEPVAACGRAESPTISWVRSKVPCTTSIGSRCAYFNARVAGFRSGARLRASLSVLDGGVVCGSGCLRPVVIGQDGRATIDGTDRTVRGRPAAFQVTLATSGKPARLRLRVGDESIVVQQPTR